MRQEVHNSSRMLLQEARILEICMNLNFDESTYDFDNEKFNIKDLNVSALQIFDENYGFDILADATTKVRTGESTWAHLQVNL